MSTSLTEVDVSMMLCDAAQSIGGKLYILGGGWTQAMTAPGIPIAMALAVRFLIPWDQANHRFAVRLYLTTDDGQPVDLGEGRVEARTQLEVGRPPGLETGSSLDATLALNAGALPLEPGSYVWALEMDDTVRARTLFRVRLQR